MSATAALAWINVCSESVKIIAAHQPTRSPAICLPQARMHIATSAAAIADGNRALFKREFMPGFTPVVAACVAAAM